jgi:hypothetical protein
MSDDTPHIDELFVWTVAEPDGSEGIVVVHDSSATLMSRHRDFAEKMRPWALAVGEATGHRVRLVRFSRGEIVEEHPTAH